MVPGPRGQHSGKIRFIVVLTPPVAYPEVNVQVRDLVRVVGIVDRLQSECMHARSNAHVIGQAKSSIPALSYFQVGGMQHDQALYVKVSYIPSAYSSCSSSMRRELYAAVQWCIQKCTGLWIKRSWVRISAAPFFSSFFSFAGVDEYTAIQKSEFWSIYKW